MKIVLTHGYFINEDAKEQEIMRPYIPLGILYISAWLQKHEYDNEIFDSTFQSFDKQKVFLKEFKPNVIGLYTNLMTKLNVLRLIQFVRGEEELKHTKIILGGPEVRNHVKNFLTHGADYIVLGEGEETMLELVQFIDGKTSKSIYEIEGVSYLDEQQEVVQNKERAKLKELSDLPFPNRSKVNLQLYFDAWKQKHGTSAISINTREVAPIVVNGAVGLFMVKATGAGVRKNVVDEIEWIQSNYEVDSIWFVDDVFTVSHKWLSEFNEELQSRQIKMPYECITRADRMNEEVIKELKSSGCFRVWIGAESGSQKVIDLMDRRVDVNQVRDMIQLAQFHGVQAGTFIMVGYPGETEEDIFETVHHLKTSNPDLFTITVAYPIKGTPLYQEVEDRFIEDLPWETSTDRDIDFKRTYSRKYYDYAVSMIVNEVNAFKAQQKGDIFTMSKSKLKAVIQRGRMYLAK